MRSKPNRRKQKGKRQRSKSQSRSPVKTSKTRAAKSKGHGPANDRFFKRPGTARQYRAMSQANQDTWDFVAHVISRMRDRVSLSRAAKEFDIAPSTVIELGRPALRKKKGRYVATTTDHLLRVLPILKRNGKQVIATRDSRQASLIGSYWAAVQRYLQTGDDSALLKFKKIRIVDASGRRHRLLTDLVELNRQASAGVLSFESLYSGGSR